MKKLIISSITFFLFILSTQSQTMEKKPSVITHPQWSRDATIYEVNIRQYTPEGTFRAFENHLPRLQKMGIRILWLMPINPIGSLNRKGSLGSYYSIKDYLGINPEFGSMADFKSLVKKAHSLGMYVIIDWVANHTSWDNTLIREHPDWYKQDKSGKIISPVADWTDVAGLDYSKPGLRKYMSDAMLFWVKETDIDGFRCDVAGMLPMDFWNETVPVLRKTKDIFMLAEDENPGMHDVAFDATYSWDLFHLMNNIAKGKKSANKLDSALKAEEKRYNADAYRMRFTSNHDENTWNGTEYERMGDGAQTFAVLSFTFPGFPLIYNGQESAMKRRLRFFDKDTIPWDDYPLEGFYTTLVKLKEKNKALLNGKEGGNLVKIPTTNDINVYAFTRSKGTDHLLVILNLSAQSQDVILSGNIFPGKFREQFTGQVRELKPGEKMRLLPWEYFVYMKE
ncbi:MAG: alpha-amylase family glycosyl hydrolase [bacterium]